MPWIRPTLSALLGRCQGYIEGALPGSDAKLRRKNLGALSGLAAVTAHGLYGAIASVARQILPFDAEKEELDRHATFWLEQPRKPAFEAVGPVVVSGLDGAVIEAEAIWVRADGAEFVTDAAAIIAGGVATIAVTAVLEGAAGNTEAGTALVPAVPITGVQGAVVGVGGLSLGADTEDDAELLARVLARPKQPPHGGATFDYVDWAKEISGVTRAWCYPKEQGPGTVVVRFVRDNDVDIIPSEAAVAAVQAHIDTTYPVTADVYVVAPIADQQDFAFSSITPDTAAVRDGVTASLADLLTREMLPGGTIPISRIRAAISTSPGVTDYVLASPALDVVNATGHLSVMGDISWPV